MREAGEELQQQQPARRTLANAVELLHLLNHIVTPFICKRTPELKSELLQEMRASGFLEHWARLVLMLLACGDADAVAVTRELHRTGFFLMYNCAFDTDLACHSPCLSYLTSSYLVRLCAALDGGTVYGMPVQGTGKDTAPAPAPVERGVALPPFPKMAFSSSPSKASYFAEWALTLWSHSARQSREELQADLRLGGSGGLAACPGAASPGPSSAAGGCGWQQERWRLQVRPAPGQGGAAGGGQEAAGGSEPPAALRRWVGCASSPPLHTRAAFEVSLRLAEVAVGELERLEEEQRQQQGRRRGASAGSSGAAAGHLRLPAARAGAVAEKALQCARMSFPELSDAASMPAWVRDRMAAYWRLLLRAAASPRLKDSTGDGPTLTYGGLPWAELVELLTDLHVPDTALNRLPPGPTPDVAAALSAGLLPAVERMLRRNDGPGLSLSSWPGGFAAYERAAAGWAQLLAFGPRDAVFSLLATAFKRSCVAMWSQSTDATVVVDMYSAGGRALELLVSAAPLRWLVALAEERGLEGADLTDALEAGGYAGTARLAAADGDDDDEFDDTDDVHEGAGDTDDGGGDTDETDYDGDADGDSGGRAGDDGGRAGDDGGRAGDDGGRAGDDGGRAGDDGGRAGDDGGRAGDDGGRAGDDGFAQLRLAVSCVAMLNVEVMVGIHVMVVATAVNGSALPPVIPELLSWLPAALAAYNPTAARSWGRLLAASLLHFARTEGEVLHAQQLGPPLRRALWAVVCLVPEQVPGLLEHMQSCLHELYSVVSRVGEPQARAALVARAREPLQVMLSRVLGPGGPVEDADLYAALAQAPRSGGSTGGSGGRFVLARGLCDPPADVERWLTAARLLAPMAEIQAVATPRCAHPFCTNLNGDSEADLPLEVACACRRRGCRRAYCSAHCRDEDAVKRPHRTATARGRR
ncbi:hypothetical protein GPECTOR_67g278 [Gonium pectorale]|uniref:MYND-type domain-containing protein n=1 Tax=Gonium pectorale TaxID=33097 RepID=A0A150G3N9_GONPE|nr:hypothetical protein GPECTOR_67g278 [Gonium pectorale]|eukprot:KXZ44438.1 hypothetical protein GPECTOR_67g278 [Gonium pectorale]